MFIFVKISCIIRKAYYIYGEEFKVFKFFNNKSLQCKPIIHWLEILALMLVLWFFMSGIIDEMKFVIFGILASVIISLYVAPLFVISGIKTDRDYFLLHANPFKILIYFFWLVKEIVLSALTVAKVVINPKDMQPQLIWFKADYDNPAARALLANSITLTPGTITVDIYDDGVYSCHCLTDDTADGLLSGVMQEKVAKVFGEQIDYGIVRVLHDDNLENKEESKLINNKYINTGFRVLSKAKSSDLRKTGVADE